MPSKQLLSRIGIAVVAALGVATIGGLPAHADTVTDTITPSPICVGHDFTIGGANWGAGTYDVRITNTDSASLLAPDVVPQFTVGDDGTFSTMLTARADAPTGGYDAEYSPAGQNTWSPFTSAVTVASCAVASSVPTIAGAAFVGGTLTANAGTWQDGAALTYAWLADGTPIPDATSPSLTITPALEGARISVQVTGALDPLDPATQLSAATSRVILVGSPTVSGSAVVGSTLSAAPGTWTTGAALAYQWKASGTDIAGATAKTFRLTTAQDGKKITVTVTGAETGYTTAQRTSGATASVMRPATPTISGYAAVGLTLRAVSGTWSSGTHLAYRWKANGIPITGATNSTFTLTGSQRDKRISVTATGSQWGYPTVSRTSAATAKVTIAGSVWMSGTPVYGATLTAHPGTWGSATTLAYRWYQNGVAISGATASTLHLGTAQKDKNISVHVTGKRTGYATVVKSSRSTLKVATASTPTITGTKQVGKTLTAHPNTWTTGTSFSYQWYVSGTAITWAKSSMLTLTNGTKGKRITVRVTGHKSGYPTLSRLSAPTAAIAPLCDPNYAWACVPVASDVDCAGGGGNGPAYVKGPVLVVGRDIYGLDSDGDGIGCEAG